MKKRKLTYSIIIPAYNCGKTVTKTLKSLSNQTYEKFEVLVTNDGSKDNTLQILKDYAKKDKRFKILDQKNQGVSVARNNGLDNAIGDYIIFVDADDYLEPNAIEEINKELMINEVDILKYNYYRVIDDNKTKMEPILPNNKKIKKQQFYEEGSIFDKLINTYDFSSIWTSAYKRNIINNIRFTPGITYAEDYMFNLMVYEVAETFLYIDKPLYNYVYNPMSVTQDPKEEKILRNSKSSIQAYKYMFSFIKNISFEEKYNEALIRYAKEQKTIYTQFVQIKNMKEFKGYIEDLKKDKYIIEYNKENNDLFFDNSSLFYIIRKLKLFIKKIIRYKK